MHCGGRSSIATKELRLLAVASLGWAVLGCFGPFWAGGCPPFILVPQHQQGGMGNGVNLCSCRKNQTFLVSFFFPPFFYGLLKCQKGHTFRFLSFLSAKSNTTYINKTGPCISFFFCLSFSVYFFFSWRNFQFYWSLFILFSSKAELKFSPVNKTDSFLKDLIIQVIFSQNSQNTIKNRGKGSFSFGFLYNGYPIPSVLHSSLSFRAVETGGEGG